MKGLFVLVAIAGMFYAMFAASGTPAGAFAPNDLWIKTSLEAMMEKDSDLDLDRIDVSVQEGTVRLNGTVLTDLEKGEAEKLAVQIPGIRALDNDIRVVPDLNQDIRNEKEVKSDLLEDPSLHIRDLEVQTVNGVTILHGIVNREDKKRLASQVATTSPGVDRVINQIEVLYHG